MATFDRPPANGFVAVVRKIYNPIGFYKGYNFVLWAISAGALLGFSLARLMYLDIDNIFCPEDQRKANALPGECFYYQSTRGRVGILLHLGAILPACILAFLQFVPVIRHKLLLFHRINGYVVILDSFAGMGGVLMIAEHSFGGSLSMQIAIGLATVIFVSCKCIAFWNIKRLQIEQHRAWMIRAWVIAGFIITMRLIGIITAKVLVALGPEGYYEARPCSVIDFMFSGNQTLVESVHLDCAAFYSGADPDRHVLVDAFGSNGSGKVDQVASGLNLSFSAAAWLAVAIHVFAAELYLHLTPAEATRLRRVSYQRQLEAGMRRPGNAGLTAERLGDADPFLVPESSQEKIVSEIVTQR
ncbi:uncharacterized protein BDW43DRAFT_318226 [Aspergillus alliaceus]|uniref:uncharacterized protein n=1 Tax=Petromyces alliaceus TaxID=209559 RepID=UPI0012A57619|nr:uncharacterized protein BDW43DRAFT_318226 [Aspergillus alliaceus]KAB8226951.1 hypothetical protein BDW43DRAFT_318226 [Aspergillus alliaceus]